MKTVFNDYTQQEEVQFSAKLISHSAEAIENVNKKLYYPATIEFKNAKGEVVKSSAIIYDANLQHGMKKGESYLATAAKTDRGIIVRLSHLTSEIGERPTEDLFGDAFTQTSVASKAATAPASNVTAVEVF